ncbi:MAG: molybdenum cofactor guanylyltransferase [Terriglobales bacterium]
MENATAFILAGGKSSRMGADKAFLELGGRTLLARALELAKTVAAQVQLVGDKAKFAPFGTVVEDIYPGRGPLGGIHAALMSTTTDFNLMLAVDLPFIGPQFLMYLLSEAQRTKAVVTVARTGGGFQPLCAVYRKEFADVAEQALQAGNNKIDSLFRRVNTRVIDEEELAKAGFDIRIFQNLNTPEDWDRAKLESRKRS